MTRTPRHSGVSRRVLLGSAAAALFVARAPVGAWAQAPGASFLSLSERLTGRSGLDAGIAARAFAALSADDPAFAEAADTLARTMEAEGLTDMRDFGAFEARHPDFAPVARSIISAWYLGYTGTPLGEELGDDAQFVTFTGALMFQPTLDATIIPTFARGHTNYWSEPPSTVAQD